jgi:hypothetical protein
MRKILVACAMAVSLMALDAKAKLSLDSVVFSETESCFTIEGEPTVNMCLTGEPGKVADNKVLMGLIKYGSKKLIKDYQKEAVKNFGAVVIEEPPEPTACTFLTWDPALCDPEELGRGYCEVFPSDVNCTN